MTVGYGVDVPCLALLLIRLIRLVSLCVECLLKSRISVYTYSLCTYIALDQILWSAYICLNPESSSISDIDIHWQQTVLCGMRKSAWDAYDPVEKPMKSSNFYLWSNNW